MKVAEQHDHSPRCFYGVVSGIVDDNEDPAHEGRVKLRFPWYDDTTVSDWCRVTQPYAGNGYGAVFIPEKNDEVLVAFVHGEMAEPVVIGGLYNGDDKPPAYKQKTLQDKKLVRTKGGHELLLDDSAKTKGVTVKSNAGHKVVLDDVQKTLLIEASGGQKIEIDAAGKITVKGATVTLDATQVLLAGPGASEPLVLGMSFMTFFNLHMHNLGPAVTGPPVTPMTPAMLSTKTRTE
jgi:uncharacterized protein involved in type VI secretion and phage assembly